MHLRGLGLEAAVLLQDTLEPIRGHLKQVTNRLVLLALKRKPCRWNEKKKKKNIRQLGKRPRTGVCSRRGKRRSARVLDADSRKMLRSFMPTLRFLDGGPQKTHKGLPGAEFRS